MYGKYLSCHRSATQPNTLASQIYMYDNVSTTIYTSESIKRTRQNKWEYTMMS